MTDDELKALCESNARAIEALANSTSTALQGTNATLDRIAVQQTTHTDEIDTLLGAVSSNEVACRELRQTVGTLVSAIDEGNQRFEILRSEAIARQQRSDQRFEESNRRFEAMQKTLQRLFLELHSTNGAVSGLSDRIDQIEQAS
ncbi:MAG: hypothetical protein DCF15_19510 [Phormidesmis priestleyi]|uniref:Uncharacterized protein n=1 Tax=Phormidesmis priestleyi TaxID=268141 RepID=A0A2W4WRZ7_9CYAN|nr:MAG: hypothetical protein DCF15_19510 [Phormidesmis priestleyi]